MAILSPPLPLTSMISAHLRWHRFAWATFPVRSHHGLPETVGLHPDRVDLLASLSAEEKAHSTVKAEVLSVKIQPPVLFQFICAGRYHGFAFCLIGEHPDVSDLKNKCDVVRCPVMYPRSNVDVELAVERSTRLSVSSVYLSVSRQAVLPEAHAQFGVGTCS